MLFANSLHTVFPDPVQLQVEWVPVANRATIGGVSRGFQSHVDFARVKPLVAAPDPDGKPGVPPASGALAGPCCAELHCNCLLAITCMAELYQIYIVAGRMCWELNTRGMLWTALPDRQGRHELLACTTPSGTPLLSTSCIPADAAAFAERIHAQTV